jgi:hypothetical protein
MEKYGCGNVTIVKLTVVKTPSEFTIQHSLSLWNSIHNHDLNKIIIQQEEPISLQRIELYKTVAMHGKLIDTEHNMCIHFAHLGQ